MASDSAFEDDALANLAGIQEAHVDDEKAVIEYPLDHKFDAGFTQADMNTCVAVLNALNERAKMCMNDEYSSVRKSVMKMMVHYEKGRYAGLSRHEYRKRKEQAQERQAKMARLKHYDKLHINTSKLRSDRIDTLNRLIEPQLPYLREKTGLITADAPKLLLPPTTTTTTTPLTLPSPTTVTTSLPSSTSTPSIASSPSPSPSPPSSSPTSSTPAVASVSVVAGVTSVTAEREAARSKVELKEVARLRRKKGDHAALPSPPSTSIATSSVTIEDATNDEPEEEDDPNAGGRYHGRASKTGGRRNAGKRKEIRKREEEEAKSRAAAAASSVGTTEGMTDEEAKRADANTAPPVSGGIRGRGGEGDPEQVLHFPRSCYVCKKRFNRLHFFYDQLCPECAKLNWHKRNQVANLHGKVILLTGSRVKIGYYSGLKLLRCGATLIATSRFPHDTARRYSAEPDFDTWKDRLHVYGLDLRDLKSVVRFTDQLAVRYKRLDAIVNNAAQTVRRPPAYYRHLMPLEMKKTDELSPAVQAVIKSDPHIDAKEVPSYIRLSQAISLQRDESDAKTETKSSAASSSSITSSTKTTTSGVTISEMGDNEEIENTTTIAAKKTARVADVGDVISSVIADVSSGGSISAAMSQMVVSPGDEVYDTMQFPEGHYDVTGQQLDLRKVNSWLLLLDQVEPSELLEVFAINALAPFIINSRLKRLMLVDPTSSKYVINVSAMEGKFYRFKGPQHPHTNMAKAALNMMTRTSAQDYAADRIYMNSVDTGWINDENPFEISREIAATNFQTPIDEEDAMARILDPIIDGYNSGNNPWGKFYKDFHESEW